MKLGKKGIAIIASMTVGVILLAWMGASFYFANGYLTKDRHSEHEFTPAKWDYDYSEIEITTEDDVTLTAWFLPSDPTNTSSALFDASNLNATIVLVHGLGSGMAKTFPDGLNEKEVSLFDKAGHTLHAAGFNLLMIDLRNHGTSEDKGKVSLGYYERLDVLAAVDYLRTRTDIDVERIGVWSESMGGSTSIIATAEDSQSNGYIKALITDSAFATGTDAIKDTFENDNIPGPLRWSVMFWIKLLADNDIDEKTPLDRIGDITVPVLLIHSEDDHKVQSYHQDDLYEAGNSNLVEKWTTEGYGHCGSFEDALYAATIVAFFKAHI